MHDILLEKNFFYFSWYLEFTMLSLLLPLFPFWFDFSVIFSFHSLQKRMQMMTTTNATELQHLNDRVNNVYLNDYISAFKHERFL